MRVLRGVLVLHGLAAASCFAHAADGCAVELTKQLSEHVPCTKGRTFGCNMDDKGKPAEMWASDGCRGIFTCNGVADLECDSARGGNMSCACSHGSVGCKNDGDCSMLGVCNKATGACNCSESWTGGHCEKLRFAPLVPGTGLDLLKRDNTSTWGGAVIRASDGLWHMFYAELENQTCYTMTNINDYDEVLKCMKASVASK